MIAAVPTMREVMQIGLRMPAPRRISGILLPLFSLRSKSDFGIGDFGAIEPFLKWMKEAGQRLWMMLPLLPTTPGDYSPYATRSAFGLNPLFIDLQSLPEFHETGGWNSLSAEERVRLEEARAAPRVRYDLVFPLKEAALQRAFGAFERAQVAAPTERGRQLRQYQNREARWLSSFALFAAISKEQQFRPWWEWPEPLRVRDPAALEEARARLGRDVLFHSWSQWIAESQWSDIRQKARAYGVLLGGDEPFIIGQDSVDAWSQPHLLRRDARLGVPPDDFSATGQDWGLPYFDLAAMEKDDFSWLRFRAEKSAAYYDLRRVDHAVGYFRQWIRDEQTPTGRFVPPDEKTQRALGERIFKLLSERAGIVAEDLGVIPKFVREILTRLGIPGYRVLRWERDAMIYRDPQAFTPTSLVTTGTHDTTTLREWWETAAPEERAAMVAVYAELKGIEPTAEFTPQIHQALLASGESSGSELCVLPWQDVIGTSERINLPGSMSDANWAYRISVPCDDLLRDEARRAAAASLRELTRAGKRDA